jgi:hypothetical protein
MKRHHLLNPKQFKVHEAWIAFRLNRAPVRTEQDGDFNCIALMDAASCFILGMELVPIDDPDASPILFRRLLKSGEKHKAPLPKILYVSRDKATEGLDHVAELQSIEVVTVSDNELLIFTREARDGFAQHLERPMQ